MEISNFIKAFGDTPINRLWDYLVDSRGLFDFSMTDASAGAGVSWNTLKPIFEAFVRDGIIKETRKIGRATMYKLNQDHPRSLFMVELHKAVNMIMVRGGDLKMELKVIKKGSYPVRLDLSESSIGEIPLKA